MFKFLLTAYYYFMPGYVKYTHNDADAEVFEKLGILASFESPTVFSEFKW